jgi:Flp pilus assembly protein TadD
MKKLALGLVVVLLALVGVYAGLVATAKPEPRAALPRTMLQEAMLLYAQGNVGRCRDLLKTYCESRPDEKDARLFYARACAETGRIQEAQKALEPIRNEGWALAGAALIDATLARSSGQLDVAAMTLQKAIKTSPEDSGLWRALGIVQVEQGQVMQALVSIQRSLKLDPNQEDLSRLSAALSMQAAQADLPGMPNGRGPRTPGIPTPEGLMPKMPALPQPPDPRNQLPQPGRVR